MRIIFLFLLVAGSALGAALDAPFFDPDVVQEVRLEIKAPDLERLSKALPKRIVVPASFRWRDVTVTNVGVRYKGNSSSRPESDHKRSFLVDFAEFEKGREFLGLKHVALDNGIQFGSLFSERLITDVLRGIGVKASRCNFARVFLNEKFVGVYVNVERMDKSFLRGNFGNDDGVLFKCDEGGPGADLRFLGEEPAIYRKAFELRQGKEAKAYGELIEFIQAVNKAGAGEAELRRVLDLDSLIKTTATLLFAGAFDQYTGWSPHNYYLYRNAADGRWTYLPWDLDVGFADRAFGKIPVLEGWNAAWPAPVPDRPLMERIVENPKLLQGYRAEASVILEKWFRPEVLIPKLRGLYAQIREDLKRDPFPSKRATNPGENSYEDILAGMESFIQKRYALARAQLDSPGERPARPRGEPEAGAENPTPGPASADAPTDLQVVKVTNSSVELRWKDRAEGEFAHVVQRREGGEKFRNAIGQEGSEVTTATDRNVEAGKTYRYRVYAVLPTADGPRGTGVSNELEVTVPVK